MVDCAFWGQACSMPPSMLPARLRGRAGSVAAWVPRGSELLDSDFAWRHRAVRRVLAAHVPALAALVLLDGHGPAVAAAVVGVVGGLLALAHVLPGRRLPSLAASLGLLAGSATLNGLYGDAAEAHFF